MNCRAWKHFIEHPDFLGELCFDTGRLKDLSNGIEGARFSSFSPSEWLLVADAIEELKPVRLELMSLKEDIGCPDSMEEDWSIADLFLAKVDI